MITALIGLILGSCAASTPPIAKDNSIAALEEVELGGARQWILIRSQDRNNPVLLFVHGGPGSPEMPLHDVFGSGLEEHFVVVVVVHWDQRGAGKSYHVSIPEESMTVDQFIEDLHDLTLMLEERFSAEKIYIVGHSWGSLLGILTAQKYPELFSAYVGIGQVVDLTRNEAISYRFVMDEAIKRKNVMAQAELKMIGEPPYDNILELALQRQWLQRFGGAMHDPKRMNKISGDLTSAEEYTALDVLRWLYGNYHSPLHMWPEIMTYDLIEQVPRLEVPVYFFEGRYDYNTPWELVQEYYEILDAPKGKTLVWFENSAHSPNLEEPEEFVKAMVRVKRETWAIE